MPKILRSSIVSLSTENRGSTSTTPLSLKRKGSPAASKNEAQQKREMPDGSITAQIEKRLRQAKKEHQYLWQTTHKSSTGISQIIELLKNQSQLTAHNDTAASPPNEKKGRTAGQNAKSPLEKENYQRLEGLLLQRLNSLDMIKRLLHSPDFLSEENIDLPEKSESAKPKNILIVDDDPISIKLTSHFLQKAEYSVTCALDGKEGLQKALEHPPDIILIDIMMPGLDGFQLLAQLKNEVRTSKIPVLILSSLCNEQEIIRGLKEGAMDFITKPYSPQVLLAKLEKTIDLRK